MGSKRSEGLAMKYQTEEDEDESDHWDSEPDVDDLANIS